MRQKKRIRMIRGMILRETLTNVSDNIKKESKKEVNKIGDSDRQ